MRNPQISLECGIRNLEFRSLHAKVKVLAGSSSRREFLRDSAALLAGGVNPTMRTWATAESSEQALREFTSRQEGRRRELWGLLGDLPWQHRPGLAQALRSEKHVGYSLERLVLD
jgi:hypothetical protein